MSVSSGATTFTIRRAEAADAVRLATLAATTFPLACPPHTTSEDIDEHVRTHLTGDVLLSELESEGTVFYVVERDDELIAYAMLVAAEPPDSSLATRTPVELRRIYVVPEYHGKGVSDLLMRRCIRHARTHGYDVIWLGTNQQNHRAMTFYGRHGFTIVGTKTFQVGSSIEFDHVMARPLEGEPVTLPQGDAAADEENRAGQ